MSIMRVHKTNNFTIMSNFHFRERKMSLKAKGLLSLMLSLPDDWDYSVSGLTTLSKDGKDGVMSALSELEKFGYLKRTRVTNSKGQFTGVEYDIFEEPQPQTPITENSHEENANEGKSNADNPPQSNTQLTKNLPYQDTNEQNTKGALYDVIHNNVPFEALIEYYKRYVDMREENGSPMTPSGVIALIDRCNRLAKYSIDRQRVMLEMSTINGWKSVYTPRDKDAPAAVRDNDAYRQLYDFYDGGD